MSTLVVFDYDGVIANSGDIYLGYATEVARTLGFDLCASREDQDALDSMTFAALGKQIGVPEPHIAAFGQGIIDLVREQTETIPIVPGIGDAMATLAASAKIAVLSSTPTGIVERFLRSKRIQQVGAVLGGDLPGTKGEKIAMLRSRFRCDRHRTFMIGDAVSDIREAKKAGVRSIAVTWGQQSRRRLAAEIPDFLIDQPREILDCVGRQRESVEQQR